MVVREIMIDEEFEAVLRPQTPEEAKAMRDSVAANGFLSPLLVWAGTRLLIDGHHRLREYKRLYDEWRAADAAVGVMQRLKGGGPKEPIPPDFKQMEFPDRASVIRFIFDTQASRRNLNDAEMSLARAKAYQQAAKTIGEKAAREKVAAQYDVSPKTVRRDVQFQTAVDEVGPAVQAAFPGADFLKYVTSPDRPAQAVIVEAAALLKQAPERIKEAVTMVVAPKANVRVDSAEDGKPKPPAWERHLVSFEAVLEKIWSEDDREQIKAVRQRMHKLIHKYFPKAASKFTAEASNVEEVGTC